jgi:hypothetical protein
MFARPGGRLSVRHSNQCSVTSEIAQIGSDSAFSPLERKSSWLQQRDIVGERSV